MKQILPVLFLFLFCFLIPKSVSAVSITINNFPSTISSDNFLVEATISGATNATNYLRVDLYKEGTSNYFGETFNGSDWYIGSEGKNFFPVQIQNSSASASIYAQLGNPSTTYYPGPGAYKMKIRRYTASGSYSSTDIQTPVDIQITYTFPTPTPTESPSPTQTPTPTSAPTPTSTPVKTPTPTIQKTPTPTKIITPTATISAVLGDSTDSASIDTASRSASIYSEPVPSREIKKPTNYKIPFFIGAFLVVSSGSLLYFRHRKD
jgi:hypothetical protein